MAAGRSKSRVLVIGATGYIGKHIANASLQAGHETTILVRPEVGGNVDKVQQVIGFRRAGAKIVWLSLDNHSELVNVLKQVDVVISAISHDHLDEQFKVIDAIKAAGNIKKFYPSEFGIDVDVGKHIPPGDGLFLAKIKIRRAIEAANIPHTYISASCFMGYLLAGFVQMNNPKRAFLPPRDKVRIYDDGNKKVVYTAENDVGTYTIKTVDDPRTINKTVYFRPPKNILTMNEQVALWEGKIGKSLEKTYMNKEEVFQKMNDPNESLYMRERWGHVYEFFFLQVLYFDIGPDGLEASAMYPEVAYTSASQYLDWYV